MLRLGSTAYINLCMINFWLQKKWRVSRIYCCHFTALVFCFIIIIYYVCKLLVSLSFFILNSGSVEVYKYMYTSCSFLFPFCGYIYDTTFMIWVWTVLSLFEVPFFCVLYMSLCYVLSDLTLLVRITNGVFFFHGAAWMSNYLTPHVSFNQSTTHSIVRCFSLWIYIFMINNS